MNKFVGMGRLTADPETRYGQSGTPVSTFSIAIDRKYKQDGQPDADFFNCVAFGKTAEFVSKYLKKGTKIVVDGHLQNDSYTKEGVKITATKIVVDQLEFAESKTASQRNTAGTSGQNAHPTTPEGFMDIPSTMGDLDIPFN